MLMRSQNQEALSIKTINLFSRENQSCHHWKPLKVLNCCLLNDPSACTFMQSIKTLHLYNGTSFIRSSLRSEAWYQKLNIKSGKKSDPRWPILALKTTIVHLYNELP